MGEKPSEFKQISDPFHRKIDGRGRKPGREEKWDKREKVEEETE